MHSGVHIPDRLPREHAANHQQTLTGLVSGGGRLTVGDFHLLVKLRVFNTEQMNQAVFAFRHYEGASLRYTWVESHEVLARIGLYDTVAARE